MEPSLPIPEPNPRGAGILFGPDITAHFLDYNDLSMVVRSHECVEEGFDLPFEDDMEDSCATVCMLQFQRSQPFPHLMV